MNKFGYFFDWQENGGYEEMEALGQKSCETTIVSTSDELVKKKNYKINRRRYL